MTDLPLHPLRRYRKAKGQTLDDLAATLEVTKMTLSRWERGKQMPRPKDWPRIAVVTGVTPAELARFRAEVPA